MILRFVLASALLITDSTLASNPEQCQGPTLLTADQWREDVSATHGYLTRVHPQPFLNITEAALQQSRDALLSDIPCLSDTRVFARLAALVASLQDGHTRLSIPSSLPERGLSIAHTGTAPASIDLAFDRLPLEFEVFEDGVTVIAATAPYQEAIGAKLLRYNNVPVETLVEGLGRIAFAENSSAERLKIGDRLSVPGLVSALGLVADSNETRLSLEQADGRVTTLVVSPAQANDRWVDGFNDNPPLHLQQPDSKYFARHLPQIEAHYVALNEIGDADEGPGLVEFFAAQVEAAARQDNRLIIDLRRNFGGAGDLNRGLLLTLLSQPDINRYGRLYVLTGPRTFSAAQFLLNDLEAYSRALFVGEDSGARPDHFGDSEKERLPHSGLTLRVSGLHWSSWLANDARKATAPLFPAPWHSELWFAGRDPALEAIAALPPSFTPLEVLERGLLREDQITVYRVLDRLVNAPQPVGADFAAAMLKLGQDLQAGGATPAARLCYLYGRYYFPEQAGFAAALETLADS